MILISTAIEEELDPIRASLTKASNVSFAALGIGCIDAAVSLALLLQQKNFQAVIFAGSAGASDPNTQLLSTCVATNVTLCEAAVISQDASFPGPCQTSIATPKELLAPARARLANEAEFLPFYTTLCITRTMKLAETYRAQFGTAAENLELFGIARVCTQQQLPWLGISVITNHTGPKGHQQWRENATIAAQQTARALAKLLPALSG